MIWNRLFVTWYIVKHSKYVKLSKMNSKSWSLIIAIEDTFKIDGDVLCRFQVERSRKKKGSCSIKLHYYDNETLTTVFLLCRNRLDFVFSSQSIFSPLLSHAFTPLGPFPYFSLSHHTHTLNTHTLSLLYTHSHTLTHTHCPSFTLTHTHTHFLSFTLSLAHFLFHTQRLNWQIVFLNGQYCNKLRSNLELFRKFFVPHAVLQKKKMSSGVAHCGNSFGELP